MWFSTNANIPYVPMCNLCHYKGQRSRSNGHFFNFLHFFASIIHYNEFLCEKIWYIIKANIPGGTPQNPCYDWGQRSRSNGKFCEFLHVFATVLYHFAFWFEKHWPLIKRTFLMGSHVIPVNIEVKGQGQMAVLWILLHYFHFNTTKQLIFTCTHVGHTQTCSCIHIYIHVYMYMCK